ncbi:hypothetical protein GW17_00013379 [Ensete ventricosum]|nr:hypothetical protein GW17_00013379 [Ensete ventricosum]
MACGRRRSPLHQKLQGFSVKSGVGLGHHMAHCPVLAHMGGNPLRRTVAHFLPLPGAAPALCSAVLPIFPACLVVGCLERHYLDPLSPPSCSLYSPLDLAGKETHRKCSIEWQDMEDLDNLKATELTLGLPGTFDAPEKPATVSSRVNRRTNEECCTFARNRSADTAAPAAK